jgi:hypothetical protein
MVRDSCAGPTAILPGHRALGLRQTAVFLRVVWPAHEHPAIRRAGGALHREIRPWILRISPTVRIRSAVSTSFFTAVSIPRPASGSGREQRGVPGGWPAFGFPTRLGNRRGLCERPEIRPSRLARRPGSRGEICGWHAGALPPLSGGLPPFPFPGGRDSRRNAADRRPAVFGLADRVAEAAVLPVDQQTHHHPLETPTSAPCCSWKSEPPVSAPSPDLQVRHPVEKGEEKGYFAFGGSSTITLFEPGAVTLGGRPGGPLVPADRTLCQSRHPDGSLRLTLPLKGTSSATLSACSITSRRSNNTPRKPSSPPSMASFRRPSASPSTNNSSKIEEQRILQPPRRCRRNGDRPRPRGTLIDTLLSSILKLPSRPQGRRPAAHRAGGHRRLRPRHCSIRAPTSTCCSCCRARPTNSRNRSRNSSRTCSTCSGTWASRWATPAARSSSASSRRRSTRKTRPR